MRAWDPQLSNAGGSSMPAARSVMRDAASNGQSDTPADERSVECARHMIRARAAVAKHIPKGVLRDSAWDMMLELFVAGEEGDAVYVKQLMIASGESPASAMRLIDRLESAELIERIPDVADHRRVVVHLSERGRSAMLAMLQQMSDQAAEQGISEDAMQRDDRGDY